MTRSQSPHITRNVQSHLEVVWKNGLKVIEHVEHVFRVDLTDEREYFENKLMICDTCIHYLAWHKNGACEYRADGKTCLCTEFKRQGETNAKL